MKFRLGFVSNSSTCSFCIYGAYFNSAEAMGIDTNKDDYYEDIEEFEEKADKLGLSFYDTDDDNYYVGMALEEMEEDETKKQFKARVAKLLEEFVGKPIKCEMHEGIYPC